MSRDFRVYIDDILECIILVPKQELGNQNKFPLLEQQMKIILESK